MYQQAKMNAGYRGQGNGACFTCGKLGHKARQCPQGQQSQGGNNGPSLCPKCKKGKHWANKCKSKRDKDGNPLPGNWVRGQPQAPKQQCYGALQVPEQDQIQPEKALLATNPFSNCSGQPQAAQDWTSVPPPTQY